MEKIITKKMKCKPIMTPNFILVGEEETPVSIKDFTEKELRELGREFVENLVKKANHK